MTWSVRHSGVWKAATPYVKHGGVWKAATPYVRDGGVWKPVAVEAYEKSFLAAHHPAGSASSFTISGATLGAASATREIFVVVVWRSSATRNLTSVTIAGVAATLGSQANHSTTLGMRCAWATVPAGTTGDIVLGFSGTATGISVGTYRVVARPVGGSHTSFQSASTVGDTLLSVASVSVGDNGFVLSAVNTQVVMGAVSASGLSIALDDGDGDAEFASTAIRASGTAAINWSWANSASALAAAWAFR